VWHEPAAVIVDRRPQPVGPRLIYVVGASGCGKDSLLRYAREWLAGEPGIVFAHRYITRPADAGGENHVALTPAEFDARARDGLFAMAWSSHGLRYGLGIELGLWLDRGASVVVNGSRGSIDLARQRFPALLPVWIEVSAPTLRARLQARGREDAPAVAARLRRHEAMDGLPRSGVVIDNNGPLSEGGEALVALIRRHAGPASGA
jgi:ribose 1,5-bisphosphokinase